eukprot:CAMPEP_0116826890 /NCGR_PEP_ID=MMETSP0418-20121206/2786_1 /TAXON_ID=1158023 /ORGANISM="Astrosyne radiata, Strain 13vi08-1A" /LENGTH=716 /DNA_ID=CAMNT_0004455587 /DNA_START=230 /DNA_END=2380 /DNA_ORIENTATION=-
MGADASKCSLLGEVEKRSLRNLTRSLRNAGSGGNLVDLLLKGDFDSVSNELIEAKVQTKVRIRLLEMELQVLPLHVACALPDVPPAVIRALVSAFPGGLMQQTVTISRNISERGDSSPSSVMESPPPLAPSTRGSSSSDSSEWSSLGSTGSRSARPTDKPRPYESGWGSGWLPLHVFVWYRGGAPTNDAIRFLLDKAPSAAYCKTLQGHLPLHLCCMAPQQPNVSVVSALLDTFPLGRYVPTIDGATPIQLLQNAQGSPRQDAKEEAIGDNESDDHDESTDALMKLLGENDPPSRRPGLRSGGDATQSWRSQSCRSFRELKSSSRSRRLRDFLPGFSRPKRALRHGTSRDISMRFRKTKLFQALASRQWKDATERVIKRPMEAGVWTLSEDPTDPPCHLLPLHIALRRSAPLEVIKKLVESYPAGISAKELYGMMPLHVACEARAPVSVVQFLWETHPRAAEVADMGGMLPLHLVCCSNVQGDKQESILPLVRCLLEANYSAVEVKDKKGYTPSHYLEQDVRHPEQQLVQGEIDKGQDFWSAREPKPHGLVFLIGHRKWQGVLDYVEEHPHEASLWTKHPVRGSRFLPIHYACKYRAPSGVVEALGHASPSGLSIPCQTFDMLPLHLACQYGASPEAVETLLRLAPEAAAVTDAHGLLPLHLACTEGTSAEVVEALLRANPKGSGTPDRRGWTPKIYAQASVHPHSKRVLALLQRT